MRIVTIVLLSLFLIKPLFADVTLPKLFGDHMVLQRDKPIRVWGWASPNERITVSLHGKSQSGVASKNGEWEISLTPEAAGGPYQLMVSGKNTITLNDVLIGDVWVCSGQSNMEWPVSSSNRALEEIAAANFPMIRQIKVPNKVASEPLNDITDGYWMTCDPQHVADFTAVGYFFARELNKELNIPIGLINTTWGGTNIESWTSRTAFESSDAFKEMIKGMPHLNLDSLAKRKNEMITARIEKLQGKLPADQNEAAKWALPDYNDKGWRQLQVPLIWEAQEPGNFDGFIWLRKTIILNEQQANQTATLGLAMIDDSDETYVNGVKIGNTVQKWNENRMYSIPKGVLKSGSNVIAVRIEDTGAGGGIHGEPAMMYLKVGHTSLPLDGKWVYRIESLSKNTSSVDPNSYPTLLFNGMIHPLIPYAIKGAIWYQGENNAGRSYQYRTTFPLMINDWRRHWGLGDFPFYYVQLASYNANNGNSATGSGWAELREAQAMTLSVPNTGMAVTVDIGDPADIHPRNKQDVGKRLSKLALNRTYNRKMVDSGPVVESVKPEGNKIIISFKNVGSGLMVNDKYGYVRGFEIAGIDQKFYYAKAHLSGNNVVVYSEQVTAPVAVRYGWADDASDCNIYNREGFPASPFRTDEWKGVTEGARYSF